MKRILLVLTSAFLISACGDETKSVEYYKSNQEEAVSVNEKCIASGEDSVNCRNAKSALQRNDQSKKAEQGTQF